MGNTTSDTDNSGTKSDTGKKTIEYFESTVLNNITIFATMIIIYFFISANKLSAYTYMDIFVFMGLLTNPQPCDKKKEKKDPEPPAPTNKAAPAANTLVGGGAVSDNLTNIATNMKKIGNSINAFTSDVKQDIDYETYKVETLSRYKETYCNEMDDMSVFGAFFFILHSSFLACYNAIQLVNTAIIKLIYLKFSWSPVDLGILAIYILFFILAMSSTSLITHITRLIDPGANASNKYVQKIILAVFSALISLFFLYFTVATIAYLTYLAYGMLNIKSEQSAITFKVIYGLFLFLNLAITIPSTLGINLL
jgi:hypothetical protein